MPRTADLPLISIMAITQLLLFPLVALLLLSRCHSLAVQDIVVMGVTGCVDQSPVTLDCLLPANLRIHTTGLPAWSSDDDLPYIRIRAAITGSGGAGLSFGGDVSIDSSDPTNSTVLVSIMPAAWYPALGGGLLNISFYHWASNNQSAWVNAFSFLWTGPPVLSTISGCDGGGAATLDCVPTETTLTITGSGLRWLGLDRPPFLNLGLGSVRLSEVPIVANDSYATLSIFAVYGSLLKPMHYNSSLLNVSITLSTAYAATTTSNALAVSFGPQPPPSIQLVLAGRCNDTESTQWHFVGCVPNLSSLQIVGDYMYNATATVGSQQCVPLSRYPESQPARELYCFLPYIGDYDPSVSYNLTVTNDVGSATVQSLVQFVDGPSLYALVPCIQRGRYFTAYVQSQPVCVPSSQVTIRGTRLSVGAAVQVTLLQG